MSEPAATVAAAPGVVSVIRATPATLASAVAGPRPRRHRVRRFASAVVKKGFVQCLGPGLVTGASDDDPSGVATYSQAGAKFGFGMLWVTAFTLPLMAAIQEVSARIGRTTGRGIAANLRLYYTRWLAVPLVALLLIANVINIGADIGAMGAAATMLFKGSRLLYVVGFAALSVLLQIFIPYCKYAKILKWLCLVLFAYVGVAFFVRIDWGGVARATFVPAITPSAEYLSLLVAVFGTTISPYLFFWQASMEVEEMRAVPHEQPLKDDPRQSREQLRRIRLDTIVGMTFSNLIAFFIMVSAAATLHASGTTDIDTADQAARALEPVAGRFAYLLFSVGIIGTGLLALPVLAGSGAYALGELLKWPTGLERKPREAKGFYGILAAATVVGAAMNFVPSIDPIKALIWSAALNGVVAVPLMVMMMLMAGSQKVMGPMARVSKKLRVVGWISTAVMLAAVAGMFWTWGK